MKSNARMRHALAYAASLACAQASAMSIDLGNPDLTARWDNTLKYSNAFRLKDANPALIAPTAANNDDGDRNFNKGLISNRFDLFSEFDLVHRDGYGARLSGAAWYDSVYNRSNDNPGFQGGAFPNQVSVPYNEFTEATRNLHGRKAEVLDAFVFGKFDLGQSTASVRVGQHSQLYGETLFYGVNGIAAAQAPVDVIKLLSVPGTQFKEAIMPVPQASGQVQINSNVSVGAYYQFQFKPNRLPAVGSYFSQSDALQDGGERLLLGPLGSAPRLEDRDAKNSGQGGIQLKWRLDETDLGFYAVRFHEKTPQLVSNIAFNPIINAPLPASYRLVYHEGITAFGVSASRSFGNFNFAAEGSIRNNQDLASAQAADLSALGFPPTNNSNNPGYAVGRTAHFNLNTLATLERTPLWNEASLLAEIAWNRVLSVTKNAAAVDTNSTRDAVAFRMTLEPTYRQVLPGLDLGVPVGVGYAPSSSRSRALGPGNFPAAGGGDLSIGLNGSYLDVWRFTLSYTHYFGTAAPVLNPTATAYTYQQSLKDRDFVAFSLRRTF
ncbi:DUF1302 domain-containing protein [Variovorax sp. J22P271]|uniref:DUF1302 domain-containing protein n=1 Tax=Variovorax davisae TaxID=3053515 RepID=UPI0025757D2B|nr:DUF1302 domain-containing protein [Variovorax sp. J22P271]MDM0032412.1 DUF1302 domain-containing protein [Variovorax sp. J22P271]